MLTAHKINPNRNFMNGKKGAEQMNQDFIVSLKFEDNIYISPMKQFLGARVSI